MSSALTESKSSSMEEGDTLGASSFCTCDNEQAGQSSTSSKPSPNNKKKPTWLESSFVHLTAPPVPSQQPLSQSRSHQQHGYLEQHSHLLELMNAALPSSNVALCPNCTDRVALAMEEDTQRLYQECHAYQEAINDAKQRAKTFSSVSKVGLETTTKAYRSEVDMLRQEVQAREEELAQLNSLYKEQMEITKQLDEYEEKFQLEKNTLELKSKSFDSFLQRLSKSLSQVQTEVDRLSIVQLPQSLFDLQVDERGRRYPLINQLRLAFRPKGDIPMKEIQVAWSQATQLLLILGTLLNYPSSDWKLVPLADCAKLIYKKEIYNMSPGDCRSFIAFNALLSQVVKHALSSQNNPKGPPLSSSTTSIGNIELMNLSRDDHVGWSRVIQSMASNLLWLSKFAAGEVSAQVTVLAHSIA